MADTAAQAWPGARITPDRPPGLPGGGQKVAGYRLAAMVPESRWLARVDLLSAPSRGAGAGGEAGEPLRAVLSALASARMPAVVQVLVRPAPRRRVRALRYAVRHAGAPAQPAGLRAVRAVLDLVQPVPARSPAGAGGRVDPLAAAAREAGGKVAARPELLAAIRVAAAGPRRAAAAGVARQVADGYVLATRALVPVRLRRARAALTGRRARRREWLLVTAAELGVLAHLPADPARYRFTTAALDRPHPHSAYLAPAGPAPAGPDSSPHRGDGNDYR